MYTRAAQAHKEAGGIPVHCKSWLIMGEIVRRIMTSGAVIWWGEIKREIHLKKLKIKPLYWF